MDELVLEVKDQEAKGVLAGGLAMITPPIDGDYWAYRVRLSRDQAVLGFSKFGVIGIGFEAEERDWNRNLPSSVPAEDILLWIAPNKGDEQIPDERVLAAIRLIQEAVNS